MTANSQVGGYLSPTGLQVFAHRGFVQPGAPENSLAAFRLAVEAGATHLETDVQATKDGVAVLVHDSDLKRFGIDRRIDQMSFAELRGLRIQGQPITGLLDALLALPEIRFNIDVKSANAVMPTVNAVVEARAENRVLVSSFSGKRRMSALSAFKSLNFKVATSADGSTMLKLYLAASLGSVGLFRRFADGLDALQIPVNYGPLRFDCPRLISFAHKAGLQVHFWVVNERKQMQRLIRLGADGIVTDDTPLAVATIRG